MSLTVFVTFWLIVLARITDVSLDTIRTVSVVQGRRAFAAVLGFFEAVVYVCAVAKVLLNMNQPVYALAYGLGFALGTYLGMVIEQRLAFGNQLVFLLTPKAPELTGVLRRGDYRLAEIKGHTREGDLTILCVEIPRCEVQKLIRLASAVDERCVFIVHDIRLPGRAKHGALKTDKLTVLAKGGLRHLLQGALITCLVAAEANAYGAAGAWTSSDVPGARFEPGAAARRELESTGAKAEKSLVFLLAMAQHQRDLPLEKLPESVRQAKTRLNAAMALRFQNLEKQTAGRTAAALPELLTPLHELEQAVAMHVSFITDGSVASHLQARLELCRQAVLIASQMERQHIRPS